MKEENDRIRQLQEEGLQQKLKFTQEGKQAREEKKVRISIDNKLALNIHVPLSDLLICRVREIERCFFS